MKICPKCGSNVESKFCPECGEDLSTVVEIDAAAEEQVEKMIDETLLCDEEQEYVPNEEEGAHMEIDSNPDEAIAENISASSESSESITAVQEVGVMHEISKTTLIEKIKKSPAAIFACVVVGMIVLMLLLRCNHDWIPATCTVPATCSKCEKTEGEALGHVEGDWVVKGVDYVNAKVKSVKYCETCDEVLDEKTAPLDKLYFGDEFMITPADFVERLDNTLNGISGHSVVARSGSTGGQFACGLLDEGEKVGVLLFANGDGDGSIKTSQKNEACFGKILGSADKDSAVPALLGLVLACDPSLSFEDGKEVAEDALTYESTTKNGLTYIAMYASDGWIIGVTIDN